MSVSLRFKATAIAVTAFLSCSVVAAQQKPTIFVYGDSNKTQIVSRLPVDETWPYFMNRELGNKYHLEVDALGGRTTDVDEPESPGSGKIPGETYNGLTTLPAASLCSAPTI